MSKLFVHAKTLIDGVSDTPFTNQLITCEDGKITAVENYHEVDGDVVEANVVTPGFFNCHVHIMERLVLERIKNLVLLKKHSIPKNTLKIISIVVLPSFVFLEPKTIMIWIFVIVWILDLSKGHTCYVLDDAFV